MKSVTLSFLVQVQHTLISRICVWACLPVLHSLRNHLAYDYFAKGTFSLLSSWLNNYNVTQHLWSQFVVCSTLFMYSTIRWVTHTASHFHKLKLINVVSYARDKRTAGNHQGEMGAVHELFLQSAVALPKAHTHAHSRLPLSGPVLL